MASPPSRGMLESKAIFATRSGQPIASASAMFEPQYCEDAAVRRSRRIVAFEHAFAEAPDCWHDQAIAVTRKARDDLVRGRGVVGPSVEKQHGLAVSASMLGE
ncbi:hypothetical protein AB4Z52_21710 [Rhizobium sp. 2YAF20]|uniref:hypothetical protein n=1 Tax=Rhizobium sp. 2YAF20 TaxID=3233027 RepID=UPI003F999F71